MTLKEFKVQYALGVLKWTEAYTMALSVHTDTGILKILCEHDNKSMRTQAQFTLQNRGK